jgi:SAM-dependent methyltransferase
LDNARNRERWVEEALRKVPVGWRILDVGAGEQPYRRFCNHLDYVSQDLGEYDGIGDGVGLQQGSWVVKADIISELTAIPVSDKSFDAIMCTEVLEHVPDPALAIREFSRIIRPGGAVIITAPFVSFTHQAPSHFCSGLSRYWHEWHLAGAGFEIDEIVPNGNYFDFLAQEQRRIAEVAERYRAGSPGMPERAATRVMLRWLARLSRKDAGSSELLTYGWHVRATRKDDRVDGASRQPMSGM